MKTEDEIKRILAWVLADRTPRPYKVDLTKKVNP